MSNRMRLMAALALIVVTVGGCRYAGWPVTEERKAEVAWIVDRLMDANYAASQKLDADAVFRNLVQGEEALFVDQGRVLTPSEEILKETRIAYAGLRSMKIKITERHIAVLSATSAVVTDIGVATIVEKAGKTLETPFALSAAFSLRDGKWVMTQLHQSRPDKL
ncbi:MAG TPA: nuclear transport factor 2 family protein [Candidatus Brocadiia bacterium]|nr:nuclear transport factor 2 family protein [Candidatus Brocadiia bacterium]